MTETIRFPVAGMTCVACVNHITRALRRLDGVDRIRVDLRRETVTLRHEPSVSIPQIAQAISGVGYEADVSSPTTLPEFATDSLLARLGRIVGRHVS